MSSLLTLQTIYADWGITVDITTGRYVLKMNRFDGAKMPYVSLALRSFLGFPLCPA